MPIQAPAPMRAAGSSEVRQPGDLAQMLGLGKVAAVSRDQHRAGH